MNIRLSVCSSMLVSAMCFAHGSAHAEVVGYTDAEIKNAFVHISRLAHGDENGSYIRKALRMAGNDTNRFARVLRELAQENTNQTRRAIRSLGIYATHESLPFLYSYATNATYGAYALKSIFAIEGVNSNSVAAIQNYLLLTNSFPNNLSHDRSELCEGLLQKVFTSQDLVPFRAGCLSMMVDFARNRNAGHISLDGSIQSVDPSYHFSKRRLEVLRSAQSRCVNDYQLAYVTNAINELVAYPESALPD